MKETVTTATTVVSSGNGVVVAPLRTELQRLGKSRADSDACVILMLKDNRPLSVDFLRDALITWPRNGTGKVSYDVYCIAEFGQEPGVGSDWNDVQPVIWRHQGLIEYALRGVAREAGFAEAVVSICGCAAGDFDWDAVLADLEADTASDLVPEEPGIGDDVVKVYPVRTALSRFRHLGADCVVFIDPPRSPMSAGALAEIEDRAVRYAKQLKPDHGQIACISFDGRTLMNELRDGRGEGAENLKIIVDSFMRDRVCVERMGFADRVSTALD